MLSEGKRLPNADIFLMTDDGPAKKKSNEVEFLSAFKYIKKLGKITTIKANSEKDTIGINFKKDLI